MRRSAMAWSSVATSGVLILALGSVPVVADTTTFDALGTIQDVAPIDPAQVADVVDLGDEVVADFAGLEVIVPRNASDGVQLQAGDVSVVIGLPFAQTASDAEDSSIPGVLTYANENGSSTVPIVRDDGSIQITTVIDNADAPKRYDYPLTLPAGAILIVDSTGAVSSPGVDPSIPLLYVAPPWAKDADGVQVPTHYEVSGTTLTQVVEFTADTPFPVVADPATYVDYTTSSVIDVVRAGTVTKWQYLNGCSAAKGKACSVSRSYDVEATVETDLSVSLSIVSASIGVSQGVSSTVTATCGVSKGPGKATLYAQAAKTTYRVKTIRHWGVPSAGGGSMHTETKTSGTLTAYKPNGKFTCA